MQMIRENLWAINCLRKSTACGVNRLETPCSVILTPCCSQLATTHCLSIDDSLLKYLGNNSKGSRIIMSFTAFAASRRRFWLTERASCVLWWWWSVPTMPHWRGKWINCLNRKGAVAKFSARQQVSLKAGNSTSQTVFPDNFHTAASRVVLRRRQFLQHNHPRESGCNQENNTNFHTDAIPEKVRKPLRE